MTSLRQQMNAEQLLSVLSLSPNATAIYTGDDILIQTANDAMLKLWGKDRSVIGKPLEEAVPELKGQPFTALLQNVWRTGETYTALNTPAELHIDGSLQTFYFDFEYRAVKDAAGGVSCILHTAMDVGERMRQESALAANEQRQEQLSAALSLSNDALPDGNEKLQKQSGTLQVAKEELEAINNRIALSENRLQAITDSPDIYISMLDENLNRFFVNDAYQRLTGRSREEFKTLGFYGLLHPEDGDKAQFAFLEAHKTNTLYTGEFRLRAKDGTYHTLTTKVPRVFDAGGNFRGYVSCAIDITEQKKLVEKEQILNEELQAINEEYQATNEELHNANTELFAVYEESQRLNEELQATNAELQFIQNELSAANTTIGESEERFRLAIEASRLATWYMNVETKEFFPSQRLREFFGFYETDEMTYRDVMSRVRDDYRLAVISAMSAALQGSDVYDIEFPVIGYRDGKLRWAHATGKVFKTLGQDSRTFFGAIDDVTERKSDEQRKNDFIGMVSHELKTPLVSLGGYIQILEDDAEKKEDTWSGGLLARAYRQVGKMTAMINSFLNMSRLESGKIEINNTLFDMAEMMKESGEESLSLYSSHTIVYQPVEPMPVNADRDKIAQVVNNLVSNATKYSPHHTIISVSCLTAGGMAKVCVTDQGMGIAQSEIPKLFDRYYRVLNNDTKSISGFGIGLYLSAEIISRHGGVIWTDSEEGKGSTFCFTIPLVK